MVTGFKRILFAGIDSGIFKNLNNPFREFADAAFPCLQKLFKTLFTEW